VGKKTKQSNGDTAVVLCDCAGTLRSRLDFDQIREHLNGLEATTSLKVCSKLCQQNQCSKTIKSLFEKNKQTKRLIIGACDPEIFNESLKEALRGTKLNDGLLWRVNTREHCAWNAGTPKSATNKAKDILSAAIRRVQVAEPLKQKKYRVNQNVLVLGGDIAAMQTAIGLSQLGHHVTLATKEQALGGPAAQTPELYSYMACDSSQAEELVRTQVDELIGQIKKDRQIRVQTTSNLKSLKGEFGSFTAVVGLNGKQQNVSAGAIVLTTDSANQNPELAELIHNGENIPKRIAIVMDIAGEQGKGISAQVLSAAELLAIRFAAEVKIYCHHIRVAATGMEALYSRAREAGVTIVKYESPPEISGNSSKKIVSVHEPLLGSRVDEEFDLVIMADSAKADNIELMNLIEGLRPGPAGQLQADNVWLLPTKTNREGIFFVGTTPDADEFRNTQTDGLATANQIHELLKNKQIEIFDDAAVVDGDKCILCLTCMRICPNAAVSIDIENKVASVSVVTCQRCGMCAAQCPAGAIELPRYTQKQITAEVGDKPKITVFACENSAFPAATTAGTNRSKWQKSAQLIRVPCAGKVDTRDVLRALENGAKKVMILGCHLENCKYLSGSDRTAKRTERLNTALEKAGIEKERVIFGQLASVEPYKFLEYISNNGA